MLLPDTLAYLRDIAMSEAKRRSHQTVEPRHLAAAVLRSDREVLVAYFGDRVLDAVERSLNPSGEAFTTPLLSDVTVALLEDAAGDREPLNALVTSLGPILRWDPIDSIPDPGDQGEDTDTAVEPASGTGGDAEGTPASSVVSGLGGVAGGRVLRVFVSSTFRDMGADRDELVKRVFPRLRRLCDERGVVWGEVDLRWGITEEQSDEGEVLPICLALIDRTRPYFIGLVGECYGSLAGEVPDGLADEEPWLREHGDRSLTELEILHGVLRDPEMAEHAFFYLRDPGYVDTLPEGVRDGFRELDEGSVARLDDLKGRIRGSGFPVRDGYRDPVALGDLVFEDLAALIDSLFPVGSAPDPLDREAGEHEMFARSRTGVYVGGEAYFERLDAHAHGDGLPLVVVGGSGSGKSALVAKWATGWRETHPDDLVLMHFIGGTPQSSDWAAMLRRVMGELARRFGIDVEIPDQPDALRAGFGGFLYMAAARGRVILVLDALNQLEARQGALDLSWLPPVIPPEVRVVVSSLPGRALDRLGERGWPTLEVTPLDIDDRRKLVSEYLAQYDKQLSDTRTERIVATSQAANPLYLRALIEELRVFGQHDDLDDRIGHYLAAVSPVELYQRILGRYEQDFERDREGLVRDAMSLLWAARRGLTETELLEMLGDETGPLPAAFWSPLFLAVEESLVDRGGLVGFFHDYLRQAIQDRYLPDLADRRTAHLRIATYLDPMRLTSRGIDELPWQLAEAQAWESLYTLLGDPVYLKAAWEIDPFEVKTVWARLEQASPLRMTDAYQSIIHDPDRYTGYLWVVAALLGDMGHPQQALGLYGHLVEHYRQTGDRENLAAFLGNQAGILQRRGDPDGAMTLHKEVEGICRELGDQDGLAGSLGNQAIILQGRGDLDGAMTLHKEAERIFRELGNQGGRQGSLGNQALNLKARGDLDGAMSLHKEQEGICRELGNPEGLAASLGDQGLILQARGDLDGAMTLHKEEEGICRELGNLDGLQASLGNQGLILQARGDLDGAMTLHKEQEGICRELGNLDGLQASLGNQGLILQDRGDLDGAMTLHKEEEGICRELGNLDGLQASLGNQGLILQDRGDLDGAMTLHKEQEGICRELGNPDGLQASLGNQGLILQDRGDLDGAMTLHKEEEGICRELGNPDGLQRSLGNQALILQDRGDLDGAMTLHKEREGICREFGNPEGLAASLGNQAVLLAQPLGQPREALPLAEEAHRLATEHGLSVLAEQTARIVDFVRQHL